MKNLIEAPKDAESSPEATNWTSLSTYKGHHGIINGLLVYKDQLFSCSDDMTARSWDIERTERIHMFRGAAGPITAIDADSGAIFGASEDGFTRAWDVKVRFKQKLDNSRSKKSRQFFSADFSRVSVLVLDGKSFVSVYWTQGSCSSRRSKRIHTIYSWNRLYDSRVGRQGSFLGIRQPA